MRHILSICAMAALACTWGCATNSDAQMKLAQAMNARNDPKPAYRDSAVFLRTYTTAHDKDYVMWSMDYISLCLLNGDFDAARVEMLKCYDDIQRKQDTDKETAAALSNEAAKLFKGEPFERAMLCTYLGMVHYMMGDYNNARIFASRADMEDATTEEDMKDFRHDFGAAHYWLGRAFMKMGNTDNARIAFQKAGQHIARANETDETRRLQEAQNKARSQRTELEKESYRLATTAKPPVAGACDMSTCPVNAQLPAVLPDAPAKENPVLRTAASPEEFFTVDYQNDVNLLIMVEVGPSPIKYLIGENGYMDAIMRAPYDERGVVVYVDGHKAGPAFPLVDIFHQADTRGTSEKDKAQTAKGISQAVLRRMPYIGYAAAYWDVRADSRYWALMPGEVHMFAAKVKPGRYTIRLECLDSNGYLLPRHRLTRYYVPVTEGKESIYLMNPRYEADNQYVAPKQ